VRRSVLSGLEHRPSRYCSGVFYMFARGPYECGRLMNRVQEAGALGSNTALESWGTEDVPAATPYLAGMGFLATSLAGNSSLLPTWPIFAAASVALLWIGRGLLARAPTPVRKLIKLLVAFLFLCAFVELIGWEPFWRVMNALGLSKNIAGRAFIGPALLIWFLASVWILFSRPRRAVVTGTSPESVSEKSRTRSPRESAREIAPSVPPVRFSDVGGMENEKQQIRELVESQLNSKKYKRYGIVRNGMLLYGPKGTGKTFLAEATAGEFRLNFHYVSGAKLVESPIGATASNVRYEFARALVNKPALLFLDEIDSLGAARQDSSGSGDPGGGGRELNTTVVQLMQSIDQSRREPGFILMAATNKLDGLDDALIREGRFDLRVRVDLPDEVTRSRIFKAQLSTKPWQPFDLQEFARRTPGASAAKIRNLVDRAALFAAREDRMIEAHDLRRALDQSGGTDRPLFETVQWEDLVADDAVEKDLRILIRLLEDRDIVRKTRVPVPTGLVLIGPTGVGKSMIARLIATQTRRSYYPVTPADVLGGNVGDSVKRIQQVFARAKENSPSLIFLDEMDGLFPNRRHAPNQHDVQLVEQFLIEVSALGPDNNVFLVGATNHVENIDPSVLGGHRFSEKLRIGLPGPEGCQKLLRKYLADVQLAPSTTLEQVSQRVYGSAPADIEAICTAAKRFAFSRMGESLELPPLSPDDFENAVKRVRGQY
jgi:transitional endoplasmic reticulum ATPase